MARPVEQIHEGIPALSASEKETLLRLLWEELDGPASPGVEAKWLAEAQRRDAEFESGAEAGIPGEEVFQDIRASLKSRSCGFAAQRGPSSTVLLATAKRSIAVWARAVARG